MSEGKVIIDDTIEEKEEVEIETEGLESKELESAKKFGIVKEEEAEKKEEKKEDEKKEEDGGEKQLDPVDFDSMDEAYSKDVNKFHTKFTPNSKALYFKYKRNKQLRQEAQELADTAVKDRELLEVKERSYTKQLADIEAILDKIDSGDENITTADIRKIIAFRKETAERKEEETKNEKPAKKEEDKRHVEYLQEKAKNSELLGKSKYEDFSRYVDLANDVVAQDKDIASMLTKAYHDPEVDEEQLVEKIVKIARMNPDFYKKAEDNKTDKIEKKDKQEIDRMVANASKKKTSAALTSGSGRREVSYDELTLADVAKMDRKQWNALPNDVRERLKKESCK